VQQSEAPNPFPDGNLNSLDINYDTFPSTPVLFDPVGGLISQTPIVCGGTVMIGGLVINR
jgi:hypothetical protein